MAWYFYVHISIPVIIYLRIKGGYSWRFIPLTLLGAFAGQYIGGIHQQEDESAMTEKRKKMPRPMAVSDLLDRTFHGKPAGEAP